MIRVLEVFREPIANGGQESFLMNMYRHIDRSKVQMDFLTPFTVDNQALKEEIESMGGKVFAGGYPFGENNNKVFKEVVREFFKTHPYDIVHFHSGSTYALMEGSKLAYQAGIPHRIVHSHCGGFDNLKYRVIKTISIPALMKYPTDYLACSNLAAQWKFPPQIIRNHEYKVIKNAVDADAFAYDPALRKEARKELGVSDSTLVVGHAGRFSLQKNHAFLIDIFADLHKRHPDSVLVLCGDGELREEIEQKVKDLGLRDAVRFLGIRKDMPKWMNAMDVFVMPSFFEGLPVVGVEAQSTGLPVLAADTIAHELPIEDLVQYIPLGDTAPWVNAILKIDPASRRNTRAEIEKAGYEIHQAAEDFQAFYEGMAKA